MYTNRHGTSLEISHVDTFSAWVKHKLKGQPMPEQGAMKKHPNIPLVILLDITCSGSKFLPFLSLCFQFSLRTGSSWAIT